jgi:hypothetical protein
MMNSSEKLELERRLKVASTPGVYELRRIYKRKLY